VGGVGVKGTTKKKKKKKKKKQSTGGGTARTTRKTATEEQEFFWVGVGGGKKPQKPPQKKGAQPVESQKKKGGLGTDHPFFLRKNPKTKKTQERAGKGSGPQLGGHRAGEQKKNCQSGRNPKKIIKIPWGETEKGG